MIRRALFGTIDRLYSTPRPSIVEKYTINHDRSLTFIYDEALSQDSGKDINEMRPMKPAVMLEGHLSKRERARRTMEEDSMLTGKPMLPSEAVRADPAALEEFRRIKKMLGRIGKDDSLYSAQICRYCLLHSECLALEDRRQKMEAAGEAAEKDADRVAFYRLANDCDRQIMSKRRMMADIEKDNVMTIASALRNVPKQQPHVNPLIEALKN